MLKKLQNIKIPMYYKIMISFLGLMIAMVLILMASSWYAQQNAADFLMSRMVNRVGVAEDDLGAYLDDNGFDLSDDEAVDYINNYAMKHEIRFEVFDSDGNLIYSNTKALEESDDGKRLPPWMDDRGVIERIPIEVEGLIYGYIEVKVFDPRVMNPTDFQFFQQVGQTFTYVIMATFVIMIIVSFFLARSITRPLKKVGKTASEIQAGQLDARAEVRSKTLEIVSLAEDINQMASTLERQDELRKQVTSDMAHEIRTPLTALKNFFEAFMDGVYEPNQTNMEKCYDEIIRMSDLVERLKDLASIEQTNVTQNKEMLDLGIEAKTMSELLMPEFEQKGQELVFEAAEGVGVHMDQNHLRQIIGNLLTNACRYSDQGGKVTMGVKSEGEWSILTVMDNGIGISSKDQSNIFERFYRADKSRDRATGGMGVGLTIVKTLVESYGGSIELLSEVGKGSTFTVYLPKK